MAIGTMLSGVGDSGRPFGLGPVNRESHHNTSIHVIYFAPF